MSWKANARRFGARSCGGFSSDFHLVHLGRFALGGAGLIMTEATSVTEDGRITPGCNGLWLDAQIDNLRRITTFLHQFGAAAGMQLGHSGWKGATRRPWHGGGPLTAEDRELRGEEAWETTSPSAEPFSAGWRDAWLCARLTDSRNTPMC